MFEELGEGFTLLSFDADPASVEGFGDASARLRMPLKLVTDRREGGRERYEASMILVRPDQFVAWSSDAGPFDASTWTGVLIGAGSRSRSALPGQKSGR